MDKPEFVETELIKDVRREGPVCIVTIQGEVDIANAAELRVALQSVDLTCSAAIVDMTRVTYMDSSGFAALLDVARRLRPQDISLHLVGCNSTITHLMEITRFNTVLQMHHTLHQAREAISTRPTAGRVFADG